jgi:hypothetical protein
LKYPLEEAHQVLEDLTSVKDCTRTFTIVMVCLSQNYRKAKTKAHNMFQLLLPGDLGKEIP